VTSNEVDEWSAWRSRGTCAHQASHRKELDAPVGNTEKLEGHIS
jgi:hypothetical protein